MPRAKQDREHRRRDHLVQRECSTQGLRPDSAVLPAIPRSLVSRAAWHPAQHGIPRSMVSGPTVAVHCLTEFARYQDSTPTLRTEDPSTVYPRCWR